MLPLAENPFLERWSDRDEQRTLGQAEQRIRERVEALYRRLVRRALNEAEGLCDLAEDALRREGVAMRKQRKA